MNATKINPAGFVLALGLAGLWLTVFAFTNGDPLDARVSRFGIEGLQVPILGFALTFFAYLAACPGHFGSFCARIDSGTATPADRSARGAILAGLIVMGFGFRIAHLGDFALVCDEAIFVYTSSLETLAEVYENTLMNSHPPMNFFMLHAMLDFSWDPVFLRLPSVITGALMIWATYLFGRELLGEIEGLFMAFLVTFSPNLILISRVLRNYTPGMLLVLFALFYLVRFVRTRSRHDLVFFSLLELAAFTWHYAFIVVFVGANIALGALMLVRRERIKEWIAVIVAQIPLGLAILAVFIEVIPRMPDFVRNNVVSFMIEEFFIGPTNFWIPFVSLLRYLFNDTWAVGALNTAITLVFLTLFLASFAVMIRRRLYWPLFLCLVCIPIAYAFAIGKKMPFGGTRHSYYLYPFIFAMIASVVAEMIRGFGRGLGRDRGVAAAAAGAEANPADSSPPSGSSPRASRVGIAAVALLSTGYAFAAMALHADEDPYLAPMLPENREVRPYYKGKFYKVVEAPAYQPDLERLWRVLKQHAGPDDIVLLSYPTFLTLRFWLDPGESIVFDTSIPLHFERDGIRFYYSTFSGWGHRPINIMRATQDVSERYGLARIGKVWLPSVGWEVWNLGILRSQLMHDYESVIIESDTYRMTNMQLLEIDGTRALELGRALAGQFEKPWPEY